VILTVLITILAAGAYAALMAYLPDPQASDQPIYPGSVRSPRHAADTAHEALLFREFAQSWRENTDHWWREDIFA